MKKILSIFLILGYAFSINGTITFYDGSTLKGELSSSDVRHVFITPNGLVMPEKIPVVDIDNFVLENGLTLIENGVAQQTFLDGKFSVIKREVVEEYSSPDDDELEEYYLGNLDYFSVSTFYGMPVYFRPSLLLENDKAPTSLPNLGFDFSLPFFPVGPVNMSAGGRLLTFGFDKEYGSADNLKQIKSITIAGLLKTDMQPILNFFGENIHPTIEAGITNPVNGKYAERGVAEALEETSQVAAGKSNLAQLYESFILYPKATSQLAKTVLSPITHVRNFVSAGAFATAIVIFMTKSRTGQAIRATAQDARAARVLGIDTDKVYMLTFALNSAICGIAGVLVSMIWVLQPFYGIVYSLRTFAIVTAAGLGNLPGVIGMSFILGWVEQYAGIIAGAEWQIAAAVFVLIGVLLWRQIQMRRLRQVVR